MELVGAAEVYAFPKVYPGRCMHGVPRGLPCLNDTEMLHTATNLNLQVPAFSFSAWVELDKTFTSGYVVRKSPQTGLGAASSVCWVS